MWDGGEGGGPPPLFHFPPPPLSGATLAHRKPKQPLLLPLPLTPIFAEPPSPFLVNGWRAAGEGRREEEEEGERGAILIPLLRAGETLNGAAG